jgi:cation diffusion facilitator family transporter
MPIEGNPAEEMLPMVDPDKTLKVALWLTVIGGVIDLALAILKIVFGYCSDIQSITADGFHSLSDFVADIFVYVFVKISHKPVSRGRPYGQRKVESFASLVIAAILFITALFLIKEAIENLSETPAEIPIFAAIILTISAIAVKEILFWVTIIHGNKVGSTALVANAWHHRSDALSSVAVLACLLLGSFLGNRALWDLLGVTAVATMIVKAAWDIARGSFVELFDYAPPAEILAKIETVADEEPDVVLVHDLRVRTIGGAYHITLSMELDCGMTIGECHSIVTRIKQRIRAELPDIFSILIQVAPAGSFASRLKEIGLENLQEKDLL